MAHRDRPNATATLRASGQSVWLDNINRAMFESGSLARHIADLAVSGLTSNPTIFGCAMSGSTEYDVPIIRWAALLEAMESKTARLAHASARSSTRQGGQHGQ